MTGNFSRNAARATSSDSARACPNSTIQIRRRVGVTMTRFLLLWAWLIVVRQKPDAQVAEVPCTICYSCGLFYPLLVLSRVVRQGGLNLLWVPCLAVANSDWAFGMLQPTCAFMTLTAPVLVVVARLVVSVVKVVLLGLAFGGALVNYRDIRGTPVVNLLPHTD